MAFKNILKSIIPLPKNIQMPINGRGVYDIQSSKKFWNRAATEPITAKWGNPYVSVYCQEHKTQEMVPSATYHDGLISIWYRAGRHPKFSILNLWINMRPRAPIIWLHNLFREKLWGGGIMSDNPNYGKAIKLVETCKSPKKLIDDLYALAKSVQPVRFKAGGRTWSIPKDFRERYKAKDFKLDEYLKEPNQDRRRLMLMSRSFAIEDVIKTMRVHSVDNEGELLIEGSGWREQLYLHVQCPTTKEHYLLGIPVRRKCIHGYPSRDGRSAIHPQENPVSVRCYSMSSEIDWTPSQARRWTFGLDDTDEFLVEA